MLNNSYLLIIILGLRWVNLVVSAKHYSTRKMFGTILSKLGSEYMDVCSGDSGGLRI